MSHMVREITLEITVTVPATTGESEVQLAINDALNEPPCDWGDWVVGLATITTVTKHTGVL